MSFQENFQNDKTRLEWLTKFFLLRIKLELAKPIKKRISNYTFENERMAQVVEEILSTLHNDDLITFIRDNTPIETGLASTALMKQWNWCSDFIEASKNPALTEGAVKAEDFYHRETIHAHGIVRFLLISFYAVAEHLIKREH